MARPEMDLFRPCPHDPCVLHPSPTCAASHPIGEGANDVVDLMRLAGRLIGLAIRLRVPLGFRPSEAQNINRVTQMFLLVWQHVPSV
jgi:hypothetical protein